MNEDIIEEAYLKIKGNSKVKDSFDLAMNDLELWNYLHNSKISEHFIAYLEPEKHYGIRCNSLGGLARQIWTKAQCRRFYKVKCGSKNRNVPKSLKFIIKSLSSKKDKKSTMVNTLDLYLSRKPRKTLRELLKSSNRVKLKELCERSSEVRTLLRNLKWVKRLRGEGISLNIYELSPVEIRKLIIDYVSFSGRKDNKYLLLLNILSRKGDDCLDFKVGLSFSHLVFDNCLAVDTCA